jgi:Histidine kinase/Histidine kinase-, DNA gyrase B-, and HSP90-like ATPase
MRHRLKHHRAWYQKWHTSIWRRFFFVLLFAGIISLVLWGIGHHLALDVQLVYSYSTSLSIWFLTDVLRQKIFPPNGLAWSRSWKIWLFIAFGIALGFITGSIIGDWYAGWSTWDMLKFAPQKLAGLIVMCVAISTAFITFFYQQNRLQVAEQQATESKLILLQSQLEPHMLFNTLANLRVLIDLDSVRAQAMLDRIIDYLRATLGASRVTSHALSLEFDRLDDYLALMQIRMGSRLRYSFELHESLKATPCPALILQPLVENAVLHGLEPSALGGEISVTAVRTDKKLVLTVSDTGLGFENTEDHTSSESNSGFGLTQLRERLETLYAGEASVEMRSNTPTGTKVIITMPITLPSNETNFCPYC